MPDAAEGERDSQQEEEDEGSDQEKPDRWNRQLMGALRRLSDNPRRNDCLVHTVHLFYVGQVSLILARSAAAVLSRTGCGGNPMAQDLTWPSPITIHLVVVSSASPMGPRA